MDAVQKIKQTISKESIRAILDGQDGLFDTGEAYRCCCPIHGGDNPTAFVWNYVNGLWYCHTGCSTGGSIFDYVIHKYGLPEGQFSRAVQLAAELLGVDIQGLEIIDRRDYQLREIREWINYVSSKSKPQTIREYDINLLGDLYVVNKYRNFTKETIEHFEGCYSQSHNRIVVPIRNEDNKLIGVTMRRLDNAEKAKWIHAPKHADMGSVLYNLVNCKDYNKVYLVEGPFDVWNLYQLGVENVVASLGSNITAKQEDLILKYFSDVCIAYDNDLPGIKATKKVIKKLKDKTNLSVLNLGKYNDPGEIQNFSELIEIHHLIWSKTVI